MDSCGTLWKGVPKSSLEAAQASLQKDLSCQIVYFPNNSRLEQTFWENNYGKETVPKARASGFGILDHSPRLVPVPLYVFTPHPRIPLQKHVFSERSQ